MSLVAALLLGLGLGLRHATDADHVVVLSGLVQRERGVAPVVRLAAAWGLGHGFTFFGVGLAIVLLGVRLPVTFEPAVEAIVALMLVAVGAWHITTAGDRVRREADSSTLARPLVVGLVHGLAGSAPIALLALATMPSRGVAAAYLALFAVGTVVGMMLFTMVIVRPLAWVGERPGFDRLSRIGAGALSIGLGVLMGAERFLGR
jgi:nickel/cobalt exporter